MHRPYDPATRRQIGYLRKLGYDTDAHLNLTKEEASKLIDELMPEADRKYSEQSSAPNALVVDLSQVKLEPLDLSSLRLKSPDELQPPEPWKFEPASEDVVKWLAFQGVVANGPLLAGQASDLLNQITEISDRREWERADEPKRQRILREKFTASYLRADYEEAKQEVEEAKQELEEAKRSGDKDQIGDAESGLEDAKLDCEDPEKERVEFWRSTFNEDKCSVMDQSGDLFGKYGMQFKIPSAKIIRAILAALDAASPTWDKDMPEVFYETLALNYPDQRRKAFRQDQASGTT